MSTYGRLLPVLALLGVTALAAPAAAQVCVTVDTSRDTLDGSDRQTAVAFFAQALANYRQPVVAPPCAGAYYVYHLRFGASVTAYVSGPLGYRQGTVRSMDELPGLYDQMVRSLVTGQPMAGADVVTRANVTAAQATPDRIGVDSLWYARLGYGSMLAGEIGGGPGIGFGYRYEIDSFAADASFLNLLISSRENKSGEATSGKFSGSWAKLTGLYFINPTASHSFYFGGGASWGVSAIVDHDNAYSGSGLQAELTSGYELLRASTIRLFAQLDTTLPLYAIKGVSVTNTAVSTGSKWGPQIMLTMGVGWGRARTFGVRGLL